MKMYKGNHLAVILTLIRDDIICGFILDMETMIIYWHCHGEVQPNSSITKQFKKDLDMIRYTSDAAVLLKRIADKFFFNEKQWVHIRTFVEN